VFGVGAQQSGALENGGIDATEKTDLSGQALRSGVIGMEAF
jgi:hypothetical protein